MKIIYSPDCLRYRDPGHPESPERIKLAVAWLKEIGYGFAAPKPAVETDILAVHEPGMVERIKAGAFFEPDTPNLPGIYDYARLAAGGALAAAEIASGGEKSFSLLRPPGHHATRRKPGGFCYFNNIAMAAEKLLASGRRVAIIDFDAHHGNGTQDIFSGRPNAAYVSLHRSGIYPSTGYDSEDNYFNFPFPDIPGSGEYLSAFGEACALVREFNPDILGISAGFDGYAGDPLVGLGLGIADYRAIGALIAKLEKPGFAVLEGGYSDRLGECIGAFLAGWEIKD